MWKWLDIFSCCKFEVPAAATEDDRAAGGYADWPEQEESPPTGGARSPFARVKSRTGDLAELSRTVSEPVTRMFLDGTGSSSAMMVRKPRKIHTLPSVMPPRRGDLVLSSEIHTKLRELAQKKERAQRRELELEPSPTETAQDVIPSRTYLYEEELENVWLAEATCHVHGKLATGQRHGEDREWNFQVGSALPGEVPPIVACQKGLKGLGGNSPNQDNFSITYFKDGYTLFCVFDGHGDDGHMISTWTVQTVPYYLRKSSKFPGDIPGALIDAFEKANADVIAKSLAEDWDVMGSGTCAVATLFKGNRIWTANCGDSRCVVATDAGRILHETVDHKPDTAQERARIEALGGEVISRTYDDGYVNHRIYVKGEDYPGLAMARTLGDECGKDIGITATPEVTMIEVDLKTKPFIVLASDGVWDFLSSEVVAEGMAEAIQQNGHKEAVRLLAMEARERWAVEEGDYCDDITCLLVQL